MRISIFLIHGLPGSWDAWVSFLTKTDVLEQYRAVVIDRIPYGKTSIKKKNALGFQSAVMRPLFETLCDQCVVMGHSYGGALALQNAVDYPSRVKGVVLAAGTVAAPYQKPRWYNYLVRFTPIRWLINPDFLASNKEMWSLHRDLKKQETQLAGLTAKIAIVQGGKDVLVKPKSTSYIEKKLDTANVKVFFEPAKIIL